MSEAKQITLRPIVELTPYANNARTHSPEQVKQLAASIREFGFVNPVLVDGAGMIIAGHGRVMAAKEIGMAEVPCLAVEGLTEAQIRAYILADNQLALNAGWDDELLRVELRELAELGVDLDLVGFAKDDLQDLLADIGTEGLTDPDAVPDLSDDPVSILGDIWLLGRHRLGCGDSCDQNTVAQLLRGGVPHLMVTDPPYGVEYDASWRDVAGHGNRATGKVLNDDRADWREAWALFPGDVAYVWHVSLYTDVVLNSLSSCNFSARAQIVWAKSQLVISRNHYHSQHEPCWYAVRKGATGHWHGNRKQSTVWRLVRDQLRDDETLFVRSDGAECHAISGDCSTVWEIPKPRKSETGHSTQKPVECMARPIRNNSRPGDGVYEPFSGSGTTLIAAEQTGRNCFAMELSPAYVDMAVVRWQNFTGKTATLESTGKTFAEVAEARRGDEVPF